MNLFVQKDVRTVTVLLPNNVNATPVTRELIKFVNRFVQSNYKFLRIRKDNFILCFIRGCASGKCIAPNVCSCEQGWILDETRTKCVPHCDSTCLNGFCSGANKCSCHAGYVLDEFDATK